MSTENYYSGLNVKLYEAIPHNSKKILELGCANGKLGGLYKKNNLTAIWHGVDFSTEALKNASLVLDETYQIDMNQENLTEYIGDEKYDVIVIGDLLEHLIDPRKMLSELLKFTHDESKVVACVPNMSHVSVVQRLISGDFTYDQMGLLDDTHLKLYSPSSLFKIFLDSGWLPNLIDQYRVESAPSEFLKGVLYAAQSIGLPEATALRNLGMYQMILEAKKPQIYRNQTLHTPIGLSVVVPVNRSWEYEINILKSPGLEEIGAEIIPIHGATSAADAFTRGRVLATNSWILFSHQDLYVPRGAGIELMSLLAEVENSGDIQSPIGFIGLAISNTNEVTTSGLVIDRLTLLDYEPTQNAISLDEFAVLIHKSCLTEIDANLGWHTWATDLCLQAFLNDNLSNVKIIKLPLFHKSVRSAISVVLFFIHAALLP